MEPMLGLVFIAPGLAALFALVGAVFGFIASLFGYLLYVLSGGRLGSKRMNMGAGVFKAMTSPTMLTINGTFSLIGTYVGVGWWYGTWSLHGQMLKMSGELFGIQDAGPMLAILAAGVGMLVGRGIGRALLPTPSMASAGVDGAAAPPARPSVFGRVVRTGFVVAGMCLSVYLALDLYYRQSEASGAVGEFAAWFRPAEQVGIGATPPPTDGPTTASAGGAPVVEAWPTYRGAATRAGGADGLAVAPKVLWTFGGGGSEQFLAAPAVYRDYVITGGTNAGADGRIYVFRADGNFTDGKAAPLIGKPDTVKDPVFSPPAVVGGKLIVGEGLHQHQVTRLRCLDLTKTGADRTVWALKVDSHLESGPAVVGDRVYTAAGDEGVLCVSLSELAKPARTEDGEKLPAEPKVIWRNKASDPARKLDMHADTSPAVAAGRVVVGSGRFTEERDGQEVTVGDCAVVCLAAADGKLLWRQELSAPDAARPMNPWGSPAIVWDTVLVGCSTCRFDPKELAGSRGAVVALDLKTGAEKWRKETPGGVLSSVAIADDRIVFCSADGGLHALAPDGSDVWSVNLGAGVMAAPTVAGAFVYAVDVAGVVHARRLSDGAEVWRLDLAKALKGKPGLVYGAPAAAGGRLFLGTDSGWFMCLGEK
jgi:outer membrane protein assembly factor BamB